MGRLHGLTVQEAHRREYLEKITPAYQEFFFGKFGQICGYLGHQSGLKKEGHRHVPDPVGDESDAKTQLVHTSCAG